MEDKKKIHSYWACVLPVSTLLILHQWLSGTPGYNLLHVFIPFAIALCLNLCTATLDYVTKDL